MRWHELLFSGSCGVKESDNRHQQLVEALTPGCKSQTYAAYKVLSLPDNITAAGQRVAAINEMLVNAVAPSFIFPLSGHEAERLSTMFHYLCSSLVLIIPGATVLSGWLLGVDYGRLGKGPVPAALESLIAAGVADMATLDVYVDHLLKLREGMTHPALLRQVSHRRVTWFWRKERQGPRYLL